MCPPSLYGHYPTSSLLWGHPTSHEPLSVLPVCQLCCSTPLRRSSWDLPSSRLYLDDVLRSPTPVDPLEPWLWLCRFCLPQHQLCQHPRVCLISGLNPFTLSHCSPSSPCVRFTVLVADNSATLGTWCLARASKARFFPRLVKPSFARRTSVLDTGINEVKLPAQTRRD
jgi:hypothetical protein